MNLSTLINIVLKKNAKKILIVGSARSGFGYTSKVLEHFDFDIQHESLIGKDGLISWLATMLPVDPPWGPSGLKPGDFIIFHQIRDPLQTISSCRYLEESWEFIGRYIKLRTGVSENDIICNCMNYWYHWTLVARQLSIFTYRVEDIDPENKLRISKTTNAHDPEYIDETKKDLTWKDLEAVDSNLCLKIRGLAEAFGYKYD